MPLPNSISATLSPNSSRQVTFIFTLHGWTHKHPAPDGFPARGTYIGVPPPYCPFGMVPSKSPLSSMPPFIAPLCTSVQRPQSGSDWVHEIKFDGYRIQMRIESGKVTLKTRKGLDWTPKFCAIATAARVLPDCIVDGRSSLDHRGSPDFGVCRPPCQMGRPMTRSFSLSTSCFAAGRICVSKALWTASRPNDGHFANAPFAPTPDFRPISAF
jgi:hypothetical protein